MAHGSNCGGYKIQGPSEEMVSQRNGEARRLRPQGWMVLLPDWDP